MTVQFSDVRFERGGREVLHIPELAILPHRVTAVLGANGAGKSTLLRLIAGLERPTAGTIRIDERAAGSRDDAAYVFQEPVLFRRSVRWNLELGLRCRRVPSSERRERVEEAAAWLNVSHLLDRRADQLSGGELRRVAIARAMCLRARLLLLDEPFAGIDERTRWRLLADFPQWLAASRATAVFVTHALDEAVRAASDLVLLDSGRVLAAGESSELLRRPRDTKTAELLGYQVLEGPAGLVAVHPRALRFGTGELAFAAVVDHVTTWGGVRECAVRIGERQMRVDLPADVPAPSPGDHTIVHAQSAVPIEPGQPSSRAEPSVQAIGR